MSQAVFPRRHAMRAAGALLAVALLGACASPRPAHDAQAGQPQHWSGRLALNVHDQPPQSYSASFTLRGRAEAGELALYSPLGSTLAVMQWQPGLAELREGERTRQYASLDELAAAVTGAALPVATLFDWLHGRPGDAYGWEADLSRLADGRLHARRTMPLPTAELRLVLDR